MGRWRALKLSVLFASGTLLSWLTYRHTPLRESPLAVTADYHSATGEIKQLTLQDGTRLWLNTASAVDVRYDRQRRQIVPISGDLLIDTARDTRPFLSCEQGQMQALGTRFSVEQHDGSHRGLQRYRLKFLRSVDTLYAGSMRPAAWILIATARGRYP